SHSRWFPSLPYTSIIAVEAGLCQELEGRSASLLRFLGAPHAQAVVLLGHAARAHRPTALLALHLRLAGVQVLHDTTAGHPPGRVLTPTGHDLAVRRLVRLHPVQPVHRLHELSARPVHVAAVDLLPVDHPEPFGDADDLVV